MQLLFIDEVEQSNVNPKFFGVGLFLINSFFYPIICKEFISHFKNSGWREEIEFKGRYLFSQAGDGNVPVEKRIEFVENLSKITSAKYNKRCKFCFCYNFLGRSKQNYLFLVEQCIRNIPKQRNEQVTVFYHATTLLKQLELSHATEPALVKKGFVTVEIPGEMTSCNKTIGIIYSDVLCYLSSWDVLNPGAEEQTLFDRGERNKQKLAKARELFSNVKAVKKQKIDMI